MHTSSHRDHLGINTTIPAEPSRSAPRDISRTSKVSPAILENLPYCGVTQEVTHMHVNLHVGLLYQNEGHFLQRQLSI
jgi:hypothetical protein